MNLRHLRTFVEIADAGGIARACERLHLSQPAASRQLLALEAALGLRLFDRVGRRIRLTSEGEDLLARGRNLLAEAESIDERAHALKRGQSGILRVGAVPQVIEALLANFIARYQRRHPGVSVHLLEDASGLLPDYLDRGDVHLAQIPAGDERFSQRLLYPTHAVAVVAPSHPLARRRVAEISDLAREPLLLLSKDSQARRWIDAACAIAHIRPHVLMESAFPHTLMALATAQQGVAVVPSNIQIPGRTLRAIPLVFRGESMGRWSAIAWHPRRFLPAYAERFVEELIAYARRNNPGRRFIRHAPPLPKPKAPNGLTAEAG